MVLSNPISLQVSITSLLLSSSSSKMSSSQDSLSSGSAHNPSNFSNNVDQGMLYYLNSIPNSCKEWPGLNEPPFNTDDFRMHFFKVYPCRRTYSHVWSQCPFYHPDENARRRDPRMYSYSPLQCASFRLTGTCCKGDECEFAHGLFETWLHPAQYRTKICRSGDQCTRPLCFFAHDHLELRPIYTRTGCAEREFPTQLQTPIRTQPVMLPARSSSVDDQNHRLLYLRMLQSLTLGNSDSGLGLHVSTHRLRPDAMSFVPESYGGSDRFLNAGPIFDYDKLQ